MGGNEPELEDGIENAKKLEEFGVDLLDVSSGIADEKYKRAVKIDCYPKDFLLSWIIYMGTKIKEFVKIPVIGVYGIKKEKQASWLVENNLLDFVAVGRAMIARGTWMEQAKKDFKKSLMKNKLEI